MAFRTEARIDRSDDRQSMLMPATWMIALYDNFPGPVSTAPPSGMGPFLPSSWNGA
jgi:hypothetical protein